MSLNNTNGEPKRTIDHGTKKPDRKYKPNFPKDMPRIPPIDAFKLDHIIQEDLKLESQEVINAMMNVASSYQNDLKSEIRRKLSIEQKIQFKNIEIAKIAHSLSKNISVRNKKLRRAICNNGGNLTTGNNNSSSLLLLGNDSTIDDEILMLLDLSTKASGKIRGLTQKLAKIDQRVNRSRKEEIIGDPNSRRKTDYPYIHKMLSHKQRQKSTSKVSNQIDNEEVPVKVFVSPPMEPVEPDNKTDPKTPITDPALPIVQAQDEEEMNAEQFELFMSSSIGKYRDLQQGKYGEIDIFQNSPMRNMSNSINESPVSRTSNTSINTSSFKSGNPLSLLYSSIIEKPQFNDQRLTVLPSIGNMTINVKSSATVKPTFQTSHFKKLRINGSPITSETFLKMKEKPTCECTDHDDDHLSHCSDKSEDSVAKRALTVSLHALESLHLSSDDTSGLNTEPEDNDLTSEPPMTSESSDFDSDSLSSGSGDNRANTYADQYYLFLKEDMKKKKRLHRRRKLRLRKRPIYQRKDLSPTPKHKPSHHSLKPKRSILKMPQTKIIRHEPPADSQRREITKNDNPNVQYHLNNSPKYAFETSKIKARPRVGSNTNEFTVNGTMLHVGPDTEESSSYDNDENEVILWDGLNQERRADNTDVVSLRSISRLKGFL